MSDIDQEWGPDHPCYYGHKRVDDPPMKCDRCGAELERNPNGRWRELGERSAESSGQITTARSNGTVQNV